MFRISEAELGLTRTVSSTESRAILREFRALKRREGELFDNLTIVGSDVTRWRFELRSTHFDENANGTRKLAKDLNRLRVCHGLDHILVECSFIFGEWPTNAPLIRIVKPRMSWYTGHVTSGGSFCTEMLVNTGGVGGWNPRNRFDVVIEALKLNAVHCDEVIIQTPFNGRQRAGPLRIDLKREYTDDPLREYPEYAAISAFHRAEAHHAQQGW